MAVETKRGCGYRKVGGLYLVGSGIGSPCDRLPFELTVCPCCSQGVKQSRGWTWIDVGKFFQGAHHLSLPMGPSVCDPAPIPQLCPEAEKRILDKTQRPNAFLRPGCILCAEPELMGRAGMLWIGEKFYKDPGDFVAEGVSHGFSRRIQAVPQGFELGKTWVLLAHPRAVIKHRPPCDAGGPPNVFATEEEMPLVTYHPGIFYVWLPQALERIYTESQRNSEEVKRDRDRGIVPVFVPDDDKDHRGNVHDDLAREKQQKNLNLEEGQ